MGTEFSDKDLFKAIKKESKDYSEDITEGFPYFCLRIFWDHLSEDDITKALDGLGSNDESIDAFFIDETNKDIHFLQFKSCSSEKKTTSLKKEWLTYFCAIPDKLTDQTLIDDHKNERVREIATEYIEHKNKGFHVKLHFFHLGNAPNQRIIQHHKNNDAYGFAYYDLKNIKEEYLEYQSRLDRTEPDQIDIPLQQDRLQPRINQKHRTLVSIITGDQLVQLRQQHRYKLFDKNLRFGLGKNKINKGIMRTAMEKPKDFYFYNNGITFTTKGFRYQPTNSRLRLEYPQIINGAQTVNAIYAAFKDKYNKNRRHHPGQDADQETKKEFKDIHVLFRVIEDTDKDGKKTSAFEEAVTRYNNSQTAVKESDFYANNPEQIKLQELFARFGYFYEIKRGDRRYLDSGKEQHNLLDCITRQADIYGSSKKRGQILPKITQFEKGDDKKFEDLQDIVQGSCLFSKVMQKDFESEQSFIEHREKITKQIENYAVFSVGTYLTLAIYQLILKECQYKSFLIDDTSSYQDKEFIDKYLVRPWLKTILDRLLLKEYEEFQTDIGGSQRGFYQRSGTWTNIQKRFKDLRYGEDKEFTEIFPLDISSRKDK